LTCEEAERAYTEALNRWVRLADELRDRESGFTGEPDAIAEPLGTEDWDNLLRLIEAEEAARRYYEEIRLLFYEARQLHR
jgi:hypothetical protein